MGKKSIKLKSQRRFSTGQIQICVKSLLTHRMDQAEDRKGRDESQHSGDISNN